MTADHGCGWGGSADFGRRPIPTRRPSFAKNRPKAFPRFPAAAGAEAADASGDVDSRVAGLPASAA
jgi:hypothetical protein